MAKKRLNSIVVLESTKERHLYLRIREQPVVSIFKYVKMDGEMVTPVQNRFHEAGGHFDGYLVCVHGTSRSTGRVVAQFSPDHYMEMIRVAKESVEAWLFREFPHNTDKTSRKWLVACANKARQLLNADLQRHREELNPELKKLKFVSGEACTANGLRDMGFYAEARAFFGKPCTIVKHLKTGLYLLRLDSDPAKTFAFPKTNIDPPPKATLQP